MKKWKQAQRRRAVCPMLHGDQKAGQGFGQGLWPQSRDPSDALPGFPAFFCRLDPQTPDGCGVCPGQEWVLVSRRLSCDLEVYSRRRCMRVNHEQGEAARPARTGEGRSRGSTLGVAWGQDEQTEARGRLWEPVRRPLPSWGGKQNEGRLPR